MLSIVPVQEKHAASCRERLDAVAREEEHLAQIEALPLARLQEWVPGNVACDAAQFSALEGRFVVGWADVFPARAHAVFHCGSLGFGVLATHRGQGLGKRLLQARIELEVRADIAPAIALYENLGFKHEALMRKVRCSRGTYFDAEPMSLPRE